MTRLWVGLYMFLALSSLFAEDDPVYQKGYQLYSEKKYDDAIPVFQSIIDKEPNHVNSLALLGVCFMGKEDFRQSMIYLEKALKVDAKMPLANYAMAVSYARKPDPDLGMAQKYLELAKTYGYQVPPGFEQYLEHLRAQKNTKTAEK